MFPVLTVRTFNDFPINRFLRWMTHGFYEVIKQIFKDYLALFDCFNISITRTFNNADFWRFRPFWPTPHYQPTNQLELESVLSSLRKSYPTILIQRSSEDHHLNPTVLPNSPENTENHSNEESHTLTSMRHRENIGRIGSPGVFCEMSVIAAFSLKTGNLMFVGFDSQNTSHSFLHYLNWNLWV